MARGNRRHAKYSRPDAQQDQPYTRQTSADQTNIYLDGRPESDGILVIRRVCRLGIVFESVEAKD